MFLELLTMESLETYERSHGDRMTPRGIVSAYLKPTVELISRGGPGWRHYGRVVAKVNSSSMVSIRRIGDDAVELVSFEEQNVRREHMTRASRWYGAGGAGSKTAREYYQSCPRRRCEQRSQLRASD